MKKPEPLRKDQLTHPKGGRSQFNGDVLRHEKHSGDRVRTVEGTRAPSGLRFPVDAPPRPLGRPPEAMPVALRPLTPRQKRMLDSPNV